MADRAQDATPDPVGYLEDVIHGFRVGAADPAGMHLDPELCRGLADGLGDVLDGVELLIALAEAVRPDPGPAPRRTRADSLALAALATPLDADGRVVAFPVFPAHRIGIAGGSAA